MPESGTGTIRAAAIPAYNGPMQGRVNMCELTFRGLGAVADRALAIGSAAAPPATYAALSGAAWSELSEWGNTTRVTSPPGGGWTVAITATLGGLEALTVGQHVYVCLFAVAPPVSGSVPDIVVDLGELSS